ncbi:hypothetical protein FB645_005834 [Coemansia sp. IMI 203386]|nr:hypothetical protein FB645_005834 [Coemansia sp. IMI 203386]
MDVGQNNSKQQRPNSGHVDKKQDESKNELANTGRRRSGTAKSLDSDTDSSDSSDNSHGSAAIPDCSLSANTSKDINASTANIDPQCLASAADPTNTTMWKEDLSNLLTPQTVLEQAQVRRRKRNREAARRSRQRQKERERELVEKQAQLSDRLHFLEKELVEWRMINSTTGAIETESTAIRLIDPAEVSSTEDGALAENINSVYALTMETLHIISELQLQLDEITKELNSMIDPE